jgi:hypothetical protein
MQHEDPTNGRDLCNQVFGKNAEIYHKHLRPSFHARTQSCPHHQESLIQTTRLITLWAMSIRLALMHGIWKNMFIVMSRQLAFKVSIKSSKGSITRKREMASKQTAFAKMDTLKVSIFAALQHQKILQTKMFPFSFKSPFFV